ncbi:hypothetical protein [Kutzneria buriramensis]|uniref:hypothetical protein n=1 Tax=Kutzneria buriramensis TaxID=1045776 RepID=UPI001FE65FAB|nr:hypothetical protein [Kutzneria buriramensis]
MLIRLYPPAIRERWGSDIADEVDRAGPRSWFNTAVGAGKLWLHPSDWPETVAGQTSRVVATALVAVGVVLTLSLRAAGAGPLTANIDHPASSAWLIPILTGVVLAVPSPALSVPVLGRLVAVAARTLAPPGLLFAALCLVANLGSLDSPVCPVRVLLLVCYWVTLCFGGIRLCVLVARAGRVVAMPSGPRLHLALMFVATGLAVAAVQSFAAAFREPSEVGLALMTCGLATSATAVLIAGMDLRRR